MAEEKKGLRFPFDGEVQGYNDASMPYTDRDFNSADWAEYFASFVGSGVFPHPEIGLTVRAHGGIAISVDAGRCWINGYYCRNREQTLLQVEPSESLPRIDRVTARWDIIKRDIYFCVVKGTASESPVPPELMRNDEIYDLCLAEVTVSAGISEITQTRVRDTRLDADLCGLVVAAVQGVDFSTFALQFYAWFDYVQTLLDGNPTTQIINEITKTQGELERLIREYDYTPPAYFSELDDVEICCGKSGTVTGSTVNIAFPQPFTVPPNVTATPNVDSGDYYFLHIASVSRTGFTCKAYGLHVTSSSGNVTSAKIALGMMNANNHIGFDYIAIADGRRRNE